MSLEDKKWREASNIFSSFFIQKLNLKGKKTDIFKIPRGKKQTCFEQLRWQPPRARTWLAWAVGDKVGWAGGRRVVQPWGGGLGRQQRVPVPANTAWHAPGLSVHPLPLLGKPCFLKQVL